MAPQLIKTNDEAQIRHLIAEEMNTFAAKHALMPNSLQTETRDLGVHVRGDLALVHWHFRFIGAGNDQPAMQTWMRNTVAYQRRQGKWQEVPGHWSEAFSPENHPGKKTEAVDLATVGSTN